MLTSAMERAPVLLDVEGLQAEYREIPVLWSVSLTVRPGEIVALVGSNGAGKSTLLRAVSGLREGFLDVTQGTIRFQDHLLNQLDTARIVALGVAHVPEGRHIFPGLTVLENLRLGGYVRRSRAERLESLDRVFQTLSLLRERRHQVAGTLSGGEQQMLAIGRGLMQRPVLLMLDEPSLGLAPRVVSNLFDLIGEIRRSGVTVLLAEQNVRRTLELADRGYVLENGRVAMEGRGRNLLEERKVKEVYLGVV